MTAGEWNPALPDQCARAIPTLKFFALHLPRGGFRLLPLLPEHENPQDGYRDVCDVGNACPASRRETDMNPDCIGWAYYGGAEARLWRVAESNSWPEGAGGRYGCRVERLPGEYYRRLQRCLERGRFDSNSGEPEEGEMVSSSADSVLHRLGLKGSALTRDLSLL